MGWVWEKHQISVDRDNHGGERQKMAEQISADLIEHLKFEMAAFLGWRDPNKLYLRYVSFDGDVIERRNDT